jgi:hypothetical protein
MWWLDDCVVFYVRLVFLLGTDLKAEKWSKVEATVEGARSLESWFPTSQVSYRYNADGSEHSGVSKRPFFRESSAQRYASRFVSGRNAQVRYNPKEPKESMLLEEDQALD